MESQRDGSSDSDEQRTVPAKDLNDPWNQMSVELGYKRLDVKLCKP